MKIDYNINRLRFVLIVLVVLVHSHNIGLIGNDIAEHATCYTVLDHFLTQAISVIAIPGLFMISGYLFSLNLKVWDTNVYVSKMRRRIHSLLIPFIVWNILKLSTLLIEGYSKSGTDGIRAVFDALNGWHLLWDGSMPNHSPVMLVTWYLRDLMVFLLLVPALHFLIRKTLLLPFILLAVCSITGFWPTEYVCLPGNLAFFSLGITLAIFCDNKMVNKSVGVITTALAIVGTMAFIHFGWDWLEFVSIPIIVCALYFNIEKIPLPSKAVRASTFIYLAHGLLFHTIVKIAVCHIIPFEGACFSILRLLLIPSLTIALLTTLHVILSKYAKRPLGVLLGNR